MRAPTDYPDLPADVCAKAFEGENVDVEHGPNGELSLTYNGEWTVLWPRDGKNMVLGSAIYWACECLGVSVDHIYLHASKSKKSAKP